MSTGVHGRHITAVHMGMLHGKRACCKPTHFLFLCPRPQSLIRLRECDRTKNTPQPYIPTSCAFYRVEEASGRLQVCLFISFGDFAIRKELKIFTKVGTLFTYYNTIPSKIVLLLWLCLILFFPTTSSGTVACGCRPCFTPQLKSSVIPQKKRKLICYF